MMILFYLSILLSKVVMMLIMELRKLSYCRTCSHMGLQEAVIQRVSFLPERKDYPQDGKHIGTKIV